MIIVGIFISLLLDFIKIGGQTYHNQLFDFIISILITIAVWEGNLRFHLGWVAVVSRDTY